MPVQLHIWLTIINKISNSNMEKKTATSILNNRENIGYKYDLFVYAE